MLNAKASCLIFGTDWKSDIIKAMFSESLIYMKKLIC